MNSDNRVSEVRLREWLHRGDPASEATPDASAFERIRRRMLLERLTRRRFVPRRAWATALAMAALFAWLSTVDLPQRDVQRAALTPSNAEPRTANGRRARQIQFVTARGMRVFWTLDPDFDS